MNHESLKSAIVDCMKMNYFKDRNRYPKKQIELKKEILCVHISLLSHGD